MANNKELQEEFKRLQELNQSLLDRLEIITKELIFLIKSAKIYETELPPEMTKISKNQKTMKTMKPINLKRHRWFIVELDSTIHQPATEKEVEQLWSEILELLRNNLKLKTNGIL